MTTPSFSLQILKKEEAIPWPGTLAIVHSYIAYKEGDIRLFSSLERLLEQISDSSTVLFYCSLLQLKKRRNRS